jgi:hypothetical protein
VVLQVGVIAEQAIAPVTGDLRGDAKVHKCLLSMGVLG